MTNANQPFDRYLIDVKDAYGQPIVVMGVPTESSHTWWEIIDDRDEKPAHHQAWHRSEIGRIRKLVPIDWDSIDPGYRDYMNSIRRNH